MTASVSPGCDPEYLTEQVGKGAENYYQRAIEQQGEPVGLWHGAGAEALGLSGEVDPDVMKDLYTHLTDPRRRDHVISSLSEIAAEPGSKAWKAEAEALRADARLGSKLRDYSKSNDKRVEEALAKLPHEATPEERRSTEMAVRRDSKAARPYVDVTMSAPKSWSLYHAGLQVRAIEARDAGDAEAAERFSTMADDVWDAWMEGNNAGLDYLQEHAGYAREGRWQGKDADGKSTGRRVDAHAITVASFRQHTSRDDQAQMHVHNAILNRVPVQDVDPVTGETSTKWMSVDGQLIFQHAKAAGHITERVAEEALTRKQGVRFATRPDGQAREILGISQEMRDEHSSRRRAITAKTRDLADSYEEKYGHAPSARVLAQMAQKATKETRSPKGHHAPSREDLLNQWEEATVAGVRESLRDVPALVAEASEERGTDAVAFDPDQVTRRAIETIELERPHWRRSDLMTGIARQIPDCLGGLDQQQLQTLVDELADTALADDNRYGLKRLTPPERITLSSSLQLATGESVYSRPGGTRYSTGRHWDAETRLSKASAQHGPSVATDAVETVIDAKGLNASQGAAVRGIATSGRMMDVLVGPAGTGKTHSVGALSDVWESNGRQVIGLATSQNAADVLRKDGLSRTANLSKFLSEHSKTAGPSEEFQLTPGQLVVVDETSMVDTQVLDQVRSLVERSGGKLLLTGDPEQLSAVGAGGAFAQLTTEMADDVYTLDEVRRFSAEWEREASLRLRAGDADVLSEYEHRGRIRSGTREEMARLAYQDWLTDVIDGHTSALTVETNEDAADLSARCRTDLIRLGLVENDEGVELHNATFAGRGDRIALRAIDRDIRSASGNHFATNRDTAKVIGHEEDGSLLVELEEDGDQMRLPAEYVRDNVELAYAGTVHAVQGATETTSGTVIDPSSSRNALYVGMSRGKDANRLYVITEEPDVPADQQPDRHAVLDGVLRNSVTERSAHTVAREENEYENSLRKWFAVWQDVAAQEAESTYGQVLREIYGTTAYRQLRAESGYGSLLRLTRHAADQGWDAKTLLTEATQGPSLSDANSGTAVLHWRLERRIERYERAETRQREQDIQRRIDAHQDMLDELGGRCRSEASATDVVEVDPAERTAREAAAAQLETMQQAETLTSTTGETLEGELQLCAEASATNVVEIGPAERTAREAAAAQLETMQHTEAAYDMKQQARAESAEAEKAAAEARADWRTRAEGMSGELGEDARKIAEFREDRRAHLGRELAETDELPEWAERLGARPDPANERFHSDWQHRAGTVAAYREAHGYEADRDPIGPRPPRGSVDARTDWESAFRGLGAPEDRMDLVGASDATLRQATDRYEREEEWAPPYVADQMRETHLGIQDWRREAVQTRAQAQETLDDAERAELETEAAGYDDLYEQLQARATKLDEVHQARQSWHEETSAARQNAQEARRELDLRGALEDEPPREETPEREAEGVQPASEPERDRGLGDEEIDHAVGTARRAGEILTERAEARAAEHETEQEQEVEAPLPAPEMDADAPQMGL